MGPRHARSAHINMQAKQASTYSFLSCVSVLFVSVVRYVHMSEGERPEEGARSGAGVTDCFEPVDMGAGD